MRWKEGFSMNEDTQKLLEECTSGCRMAVNSMEHMKGYVKDEKLLELVDAYEKHHEELEQEANRLLKEGGKEEKLPGIMVSAMSWFTTEMKLMMKEDSNQIAKLMMDGCNMGIQSICEQQNKYGLASEEAKDIAKRLVKVEEDFMCEMKQFL